MSGGRHKVFGHPSLHIVPQTSTIASHLPRAVGLGVRPGPREGAGPGDAVAGGRTGRAASFGDASVNHSTAAGALNAAAYLTHRASATARCCSSARTTASASARVRRGGWAAAVLQRLPGIAYCQADGADPVALLETTEEALAAVRDTGAPRPCSTCAPCGSWATPARTSRSPTGPRPRSRPTTRATRCSAPPARWSRAVTGAADAVLARYEQVRQRVHHQAVEVSAEPRLVTRDEVMAPLGLPAAPPSAEPRRTCRPARRRAADPRAGHQRHARRRCWPAHADVLVFGEDVAVKGGVYGVTRGLRKRFGVDPGLRHPARRADDPRHGAGHQPRGLRADPRDPVPRLPAQRRGPAPRRGRVAAVLLRRAVPQRHGRPDRRTRPTRRGSAATSTTTTRVAVLRDIPGLVARRPQPPAERARAAARPASTWPAGRPGLRVPRADRQLPHPRPARRRRRAGPAPFDGSTRAALGDVVRLRHRAGPAAGDVRQRRLHEPPGGRDACVPTASAAPCSTSAGWRRSRSRRWSKQPRARSPPSSSSTRPGTAVGSPRPWSRRWSTPAYEAPISRVTSADRFIPLGPAADTVLLQEDEILAAARKACVRR